MSGKRRTSATRRGWAKGTCATPSSLKIGVACKSTVARIHNKLHHIADSVGVKPKPFPYGDVDASSVERPTNQCEVKTKRNHPT